MSDCQKLEPLFTAYVDGEAPAADAGGVEAHLAKCPPCRWRVERERAVRELLHGRRDILAAGAASPALRSHCRAMAAASHAAKGALEAARSHPWLAALRARAFPVALAATVTLVAAIAVVYEATGRSARLLAAELAADHVKCFAANRLIGVQPKTSNATESYLAASFGWRTILPQIAGLNLEGARPCLYGEGRLAHVMYRYAGRPVSLFMLPGTTRRDEMVEVLGHEAAIWSGNGRTFVLVAQQPPEDLERLAVAFHETLK